MAESTNGSSDPAFEGASGLPGPEEFAPGNSGFGPDPAGPPEDPRTGNGLGHQPSDSDPNEDFETREADEVDAPVVEEPRRKSLSVLLGPSNAGKTTLIHAMDQACASTAGADSRYRLEFVSGKGTLKLASEAVNMIMRADSVIAPTNQIQDYEASVVATDRDAGFWQPRKQEVANLVVKDGPGGALFPSTEDQKRFASERLADWEEELLDKSREASTLVLCLDATEPDVGRESIYLQNILAESGKWCQPELHQPLGYRLLCKLKLMQPVAPPDPQKRLGVDRFLLLLTKVDRLVSGRLGRPGEAPSQAFPSIATPLAIANRLSPFQVAADRIGPANLRRILDALRPGAEFAVGLTSAWGFDPNSGQPLVQDDEPIRLSTQPRKDRLLSWRPFGVREALLFMVTGCIEGPIERVDPESFRSERTPRFYDVASRNGHPTGQGDSFQ